LQHVTYENHYFTSTQTIIINWMSFSFLFLLSFAIWVHFDFFSSHLFPENNLYRMLSDFNYSICNWYQIHFAYPIFLQFHLWMMITMITQNIDQKILWLFEKMEKRAFSWMQLKDLLNNFMQLFLHLKESHFTFLCYGIFS
jgi:hypothetical protein